MSEEFAVVRVPKAVIDAARASTKERCYYDPTSHCEVYSPERNALVDAILSSSATPPVLALGGAAHRCAQAEMERDSLARDLIMERHASALMRVERDEASAALARVEAAGAAMRPIVEAAVAYIEATERAKQTQAAVEREGARAYGTDAHVNAGNTNLRAHERARDLMRLLTLAVSQNPDALTAWDARANAAGSEVANG